MRQDLGTYLYENKNVWENIKNTGMTLTLEPNQFVLSSPKEGVELTFVSYIPLISEYSDDIFCVTLRFVKSESKKQIKLALKQNQSISFLFLHVCDKYYASDLKEQYRPLKVERQN